MFPYTGRVRWIAGIHILLLASVWLVPLIVYAGLPETIPVHFNLQGEPDSTGGKATIWLLPIIATFLGAIFLVLLQYPHTYNYPRKDVVGKLPPVQRERVYTVLREMMLSIALAVDLVFLGIIGLIVVSSQNGDVAPYRIVFVLLMLGPLIAAVSYLVRISRAIDAAKAEAASQIGT